MAAKEGIHIKHYVHNCQYLKNNNWLEASREAAVGGWRCPDSATLTPADVAVAHLWRRGKFKTEAIMSHKLTT